MATGVRHNLQKSDVLPDLFCWGAKSASHTKRSILRPGISPGIAISNLRVYFFFELEKVKNPCGSRKNACIKFYVL